MIHTITRTVWISRYRPVPKKRAMASVLCPIASGSNRSENLRDVRGVYSRRGGVGLVTGPSGRLDGSEEGVKLLGVRAPVVRQ